MLQETTDVNTPVTLGPVSPEVRNLGADPRLTPTISPPTELMDPESSYLTVARVAI